MFYEFLFPLSDHFQIFNLFKYLTLRTGGAMMTALLLSFLFAPIMIKRLRIMQHGHSNIREDVPETHLKKSGTPTMGGILILSTSVLSTILWGNINNQFLWIGLLSLVGFAMIGLWDDLAKLSKKRQGISARYKFSAQLILALMIALLIQYCNIPAQKNMLALPFLKDFLLNLGVFYIPFVMIVLIGASNAVNLTDGLDGLAIVPAMIALSSFAIIAYMVGNAVYSDYLFLHFVPGTGELTVLCGALLGAGLGFLWYNAPPAAVFMGDTGSLAIGGVLGTIAAITKHELILVIIGGLFVLEAASVIIQVASFKLTGKRVFAMAPLHHHFEKKGWAESTIVIRFWIIAFILALIGLASLKLR